jgi:hypothetical protein
MKSAAVLSIAHLSGAVLSIAHLSAGGCVLGIARFSADF